MAEHFNSSNDDWKNLKIGIDAATRPVKTERCPDLLGRGARFVIKSPLTRVEWGLLPQENVPQKTRKVWAAVRGNWHYSSKSGRCTADRLTRDARRADTACRSKVAKRRRLPRASGNVSETVCARRSDGV